MNPEQYKFIGDPLVHVSGSLLDFWKWAFADLCDDDIKGVFAEWMVATLLGIPTSGKRRISWADHDLILPPGLKIEVKASSLWQSWKLINPDGTPKHDLPLAVLSPGRVRFSGLQARTAEKVAQKGAEPVFKSDCYIFCMQSETDPVRWNVWDLSQWKFFLLSRDELETAGIARSISLARLMEMQQPMIASEFVTFAKKRLIHTQNTC